MLHLQCHCTGVRAGVLSDSVNKSGNADSMATDIASGDLPADTETLQDYAGRGTAEGRAMAQLVHDLAPGASIYFATGGGGQANFANNILKLSAAGDKLIVEDRSYCGSELMYQDGPIAQAINQVAAEGGS